MTSPLGNNLDYLGKLLDVTTKRQEIHAGNLANVNTPGYRRSEVKFEELLTVGSDRIQEQVLRAPIEVVEDREAEVRGDGNNVDLDKELSAVRKNALLHRVFSEFLSAKIRLLRSSIVGRNS